MENILHLLISAFTTCACGPRPSDCAPLHLPVNSTDPGPSTLSSVDLGSLLGSERGFYTRPRTKGTNSISGVEIYTPRGDQDLQMQADLGHFLLDGETEEDHVLYNTQRWQREQWKANANLDRVLYNKMRSHR